MKYLTFPFLLLLLPLIGFGCSSEEKETDSLILSSDSEIFFEQGIDFAATSGTRNLSFSSGRPWRISLTTDTDTRRATDWCTVEKIKKVTSGSTPEIADIVDNVYNSVLVNGTHKAPSIKVAEASKIIENSQRDVNIAFMNELAKIFNAMGIDTNDVIEAASSKWNFIKLKPGLVGGHCISVDPYYLIQKAQVYGVLPRVMFSARRLNDGMGDYVGNQVIKLMNKKGVLVKDSNVLILGFTFKENCPDVRNTKIVDIYHTLEEYTKNITVYDPWANADKVEHEYGVQLTSSSLESLKGKFNAVILAVAHKEFVSLDIRSFLKNENGVVYDVKGILDREMIDGRL